MEYRYLTRERIGLTILTILLAAVITLAAVDEEKEARRIRAQENLAQEVLRFHILANSDEAQDQQLKMDVKERVLSWLESEMPENLDASEMKLWLKMHDEELTILCEEELAERGYEYPVSVAVTTCYFPEKQYGDVTFPAGNYEALRIEIGLAEGQNWWCVLYPNLCFLDAVRAVVPEEGKRQLRQILPEDTYDVCCPGENIRIKSYFLSHWFED